MDQVVIWAAALLLISCALMIVVFTIYFAWSAFKEEEVVAIRNRRRKQ